MALAWLAEVASRLRIRLGESGNAGERASATELWACRVRAHDAQAHGGPLALMRPAGSRAWSAGELRGQARAL